ncbi:hypothetical protein SK128_021818 [Halocaridina rubra]|uniref:Uncharacterized protein n=1 Tax=Halocaridina rubra TaxID=373956 RepID=A0AAN8WP28_HALRR
MTISGLASLESGRAIQVSNCFRGKKIHNLALHHASHSVTITSNFLGKVLQQE